MYSSILKKIYHVKFVKALPILLLLVVIFASYILSTYGDYLYYKSTLEKVDYVKNEINLNKDRFRLLFRDKVKRLFLKIVSPSPKEHSSLKDFHIFIDEKDIKLLNSNLPKSGFQFVSAYLRFPDSSNITKIKLRYRGTLHLNWLYKQKSLRIKLPKGQLYQNERKFNLVNPPHDYFLVDYINYDISREMGMLTPDSYPARVFINNQYMGIYSYLSQIDEIFLRKNNRMPGSIYYGENGQPTPDGHSRLWFDAEAWIKKASRNAQSESYRQDIETLIGSLDNDNKENFYQFFNQYADKEKFYSLFAIDTLTGSFHHDFAHNHKLYFDPYLGKFEPIQWDVRYWSDNRSVKDMVYYPLLLKVALNPILEMERDRHAYQMLQKYSAKELIKRLKDYQEMVYEDLDADIFKDSDPQLFIFPELYASPFSMKEFEQSINDKIVEIKHREEYLLKLYEDSKVSLLTTINNENTLSLMFEVAGNSPAKISFNKNVASGDYLIYRDLNNNGIADPNEKTNLTEYNLYPGRKVMPGNLLSTEDVLLYGNQHIVSAPLYYPFILKFKSKPENLNIQAYNLITNKKLPIQAKKIRQTKDSDSIHPWKITQKKPETIILQGNLEITDDLIFSKNTRVIIKPGTIFSMHKNKSIYFYGKLDAQGSITQPIKIIAKNSREPWGAIVLQGKSANGSKLSYIEINNGSTSSRNLIQYPGQVNIHDVDFFSLSHCKIGENHVGDDSLHLAYSSGKIENCHFYQSHLDAVDIDISEVNIENSLFVDSGNDSLDFMNSKINLHNSLFINAKDKCISVGEKSETYFMKNFFYQCNIGIEVKDNSRVRIEETKIVNSKTAAINLYNKNYAYERGGTIMGEKLSLYGNNKIILDKKSSSSLRPIHKVNYKVNHQLLQEILSIGIPKKNFQSIENLLIPKNAD